MKLGHVDQETQQPLDDDERFVLVTLACRSPTACACWQSKEAVEVLASREHEDGVSVGPLISRRWVLVTRENVEDLGLGLEPEEGSLNFFEPRLPMDE